MTLDFEPKRTRREHRQRCRWQERLSKAIPCWDHFGAAGFSYKRSRNFFRLFAGDPRTSDSNTGDAPSGRLVIMRLGLFDPT